MGDDIDQEIEDARSKRSGELKGLAAPGLFDTDVYDTKDKYAGYVKELPTDEELESQPVFGGGKAGKAASGAGAPKKFGFEQARAEMQEGEDDAGEVMKRPHSRIADREGDYQARRLNRVISPERVDPFADGEASSSSRSYTDVMKETQLARETQNVMRNIALKQKEEAEQAKKAASEKKDGKDKKRRWDSETEDFSRRLSSCSHTMSSKASNNQNAHLCKPSDLLHLVHMRNLEANHTFLYNYCSITSRAHDNIRVQ